MPSKCDDETASSLCRAHSCSLRASWLFVSLVDVICVMLVVLIAHVDVVAVYVQFS